MKNIKVTAAIIVDKEKVLITRRAPGEKYSGGWEFPGGKIKENESEQECLRRELKEELDIEVDVGEFFMEHIHDYEEFTVTLRAYYCIVVSGVVGLSVHDRYEWTEISRLLDYNLLPADIPIAKELVLKHSCHILNSYQIIHESLKCFEE